MARNGREWPGIAGNGYGLLGIARNCTGSWHSGKSGKVVSCKSSKIKTYLEKYSKCLTYIDVWHYGKGISGKSCNGLAVNLVKSNHTNKSLENTILKI